jgi:hypothetical protein
MLDRAKLRRVVGDEVRIARDNAGGLPLPRMMQPGQHPVEAGIGEGAHLFGQPNVERKAREHARERTEAHDQHVLSLTLLDAG